MKRKSKLQLNGGQKSIQIKNISKRQILHSNYLVLPVHDNTKENPNFNDETKGDVTLVNLQRQLAMIWCCAKNHSSVTARCERFLAIFAVLQRVGSFWKRFKSVTNSQIRAKNMRCESALQVDQCNITLSLSLVENTSPEESREELWLKFN